MHLCAQLTYLVLTAAFSVSLELQRGDCSDQLTLICRHSDVPTDPVWIHNGTAEDGQLLAAAFPGSVYSVQTSTEHRVTVSGMDNVQALDSYIIQCAYSIQGTLTKSNADKYSFIPPGQCMCCTECPSWYIHMSMHTNCWGEYVQQHAPLMDPALVDPSLD